MLPFVWIFDGSCMVAPIDNHKNNHIRYRSKYVSSRYIGIHYFCMRYSGIFGSYASIMVNDPVYRITSIFQVHNRGMSVPFYPQIQILQCILWIWSLLLFLLLVIRKCLNQNVCGSLVVRHTTQNLWCLINCGQCIKALRLLLHCDGCMLESYHRYCHS